MSDAVESEIHVWRRALGGGGPSGGGFGEQLLYIKCSLVTSVTL